LKSNYKAQSSSSNSEIILEDTELAKKAFGPDISSLKSKTTRKRLISMLSSTIDIPTELLSANKEVEILLNSLQVNRL